MTPKLPVRWRYLKPEVVPPTLHPEHNFINIYAYALNEKGVSRSMVLGMNQTRAFPTGISLLSPAGCGLMLLTPLSLVIEGMMAVGPAFFVKSVHDGEQLYIRLYNGGHTSVFVTHGMLIAQFLPFQALGPLQLLEDEE